MNKARKAYDYLLKEPSLRSRVLKASHKKDIKCKSYTLADRVWLNNKYINIKQNLKLKAKLFGLF